MKTFIVGCVLAISAVAGLSSNAHAWLWSMSDYQKNINDNYNIAVDNAKSVADTLGGTPSTPEDKISRALSYSKSIVDAAETINANCEDLKSVIREWKACKDTYLTALQLAAECDLQIANYAVSMKQLSLAKKLYRDVIITYTGSAYRSYVKRAEFALEDLKGN